MNTCVLVHFFFSISINISNTHLMCPIFSFAPHSVSSHHIGPRFISRDWQGIRPPVDAAMVGRVYLTPKPTPSSPPPRRRWSSRRRRRRRRPSEKRGHRRRQSSYVLFDDFWTYDDWFGFGDYSDITQERTTEEYKNTPVQNVYFFKRGNV